MKISVLTLFPEMFPGVLGYSLTGKALSENRWQLEAINIRDFASDKHKTVDDSPYGGGAGMVMKADVVALATEHAINTNPDAKLIYTSPRGRVYNQNVAREFCGKNLIILCGRFEGVDERVLEEYGYEEISIGNYVLTGGEIAAMAIVDSSIRLVSGIIGEAESLQEESFGESAEYRNLLEYPHYTKPAVWKNRKVPDVLLSGNHAEIAKWRINKAKELTLQRKTPLL